MKWPIRLFSALLLSAALSGCGLKGGLETPPPMFGKAHRQYEAEQRAKAEAAEKERLEKEKARQTMTIPAPATAQPQQPQ